jgi:hypothetical protein
VSPSVSVPRLIVEYDDDPAGAADALLAVLRQPRAAGEPREAEYEHASEEETAA